MCAAIIDRDNGTFWLRKLGGERVPITAVSMCLVNKTGWFIRDDFYWHIGVEKLFGRKSLRIHMIRACIDTLVCSKRTIVCRELKCDKEIVFDRNIHMIAREDDHIGLVTLMCTVNNCRVASELVMLHFANGDVRIGERYAPLTDHNIELNGQHDIVWDSVLRHVWLLYSWSDGQYIRRCEVASGRVLVRGRNYGTISVRNGVFEVFLLNHILRVAADTGEEIGKCDRGHSYRYHAFGEHFTVQVEPADENGDADITMTDLRTGDKYAVDRYVGNSGYFLPIL